MRLFLSPLAGIALAALVTSGCSSRSAQAAEQKKAGDDYEIVVTTGKDTLKAGDKGTYQLTIKPKGDRIMKMETPLKVKLKADGALALGKEKLGKDDVVDPKAKDKTLKASFTAKSEGSHKINADATFFLCNDKSCNRYKETVQLDVKVAGK